jgi:hypothetical protein
MKTGNLTLDEFAKEMYSLGLRLRNYNADVMYDITQVMMKYKEQRGNSEGKSQETMHLFTRDVGTHCFWGDSEDTKTYLMLNEEYYKIVFTFNYYNYNEPFAVVTKLK